MIVSKTRNATTSQEAGLASGGGFFGLDPKELWEIPDGMSWEEAERKGLATKVVDPEVAFNAYEQGKVYNPDGSVDMVSIELFKTGDSRWQSFLTGIPALELEEFVNNSEPILDENGKVVGRTTRQEDEDSENEEEEEESPADELAQQILDGEVSPYSYFNANGDLITPDQSGSPLSGGLSASPAPLPSYASTPTSLYYPENNVGSTGYNPVVGGSLLKGSQYNLPVPQGTSQTNLVDANGDLVISDEENLAYLVATNDPNAPILSEEEQLALVAKYPHLFFDAASPEEWLSSPRERMIGTIGDDYVATYGDFFGQGLDALPEGVPPPPDMLTEQGRYVPVANTQAYFNYHKALRSGNTAMADWILALHGVDGPVLIDVGDNPEDYFFDDQNDTPWAGNDFATGEIPNIQNPPPWHPDHNPNNDIMGRPITAGGMSWGNWLLLNELDPVTGMPVNPDWDGEFNVPLSAEILSPTGQTDLDTLLANIPDPNAPPPPPDPNFPGVGPNPDPNAPPPPPPPRRGGDPLPDPEEYDGWPTSPGGTGSAQSSRIYSNENFGDQKQLGPEPTLTPTPAPAPTSSTALPAMDVGSIKGNPLSQSMPYSNAQQSAPAPTLSPLQSPMSTPAEGVQPYAQQRTLFPRRV